MPTPIWYVWGSPHATSLSRTASCYRINGTTIYHTKNIVKIRRSCYLNSTRLHRMTSVPRLQMFFCQDHLPRQSYPAGRIASLSWVHHRRDFGSFHQVNGKPPAWLPSVRPRITMTGSLELPDIELVHVASRLWVRHWHKVVTSLHPPNPPTENISKVPSKEVRVGWTERCEERQWTAEWWVIYPA